MSNKFEIINILKKKLEVLPFFDQNKRRNPTEYEVIFYYIKKVEQAK